jgi:myosin-5
MATKKNTVGVALTTDSLTETTEVFVDIEDCYLDPDTGRIVRKKRSATAEEDLDDVSESWIGAVVTAIDREKNKVTVQCDFVESSPFSEQEIQVDVEQLSLKNPSHCESADDITTMTYMHEAALLENLYQRYNREYDILFSFLTTFSIIYTYTGPILIAINPYKRLPDVCYNDETIQSYIGQELGKLPPHVYAIAEDAFRKYVNVH